jgi:hypothetical protein
MRLEQLRRTFLGQLLQALLQLLHLQRVADLGASGTCSGAKQGMPVNLRSSPSVKRVAEQHRAVVGDADDVAGARPRPVVLRSCAMKVIALFLARVLPVRQQLQLDAALEAGPEQTRTKAMRSRCAGVHVGLDLEHEAGELRLPRLRTCARSSGTRAAGAGEDRRRRRAARCTPKLLIAEPKNTGVCAGAGRPSWSKVCDAPRTSSTSTRSSSRPVAEDSSSSARVVEAAR